MIRKASAEWRGSLKEGKGTVSTESGLLSDAAYSFVTRLENATVTRVHLDVTARVPGADRAAFERAANEAKAKCPLSRLLNATITMDARLEG